jgi:hypothetical protein
MAYDSLRQRVLLFWGDSKPGAAVAQTWEWDGSRWVRLTPSIEPPGREYAEMVSDSARGVVVLAGGRRNPVDADTSVYVTDTWEWDGAIWDARLPAPTALGRIRHAMAYDSARGVVVLFGGRSGSLSLGDTWEYDACRSGPASRGDRCRLQMAPPRR